MEKFSKYLALFLCSISSFFSVAQENYDVIIMPSKFDFLKEKNQYNLNTLSKLFFEKEGFTVYYNDEILPENIVYGKFNVLYFNLIENSGFLSTNITAELKDFQNNIILKGEEGKTREKDFAKAYTLATKSTLNSLVGKLEIKKSKTFKNNIENEITQTKDSEKVEPIKHEISSATLFAIPTTKGYKIVDSTPKTIYELNKTSVSSIFIATKENVQGVFLQKDKQWYFEYYQNEKLVSEIVDVKF